MGPPAGPAPPSSSSTFSQQATTTSTSTTTLSSPSSPSTSTSTSTSFWSAPRIQIPLKQPPPVGSNRLQNNKNKKSKRRDSSTSDTSSSSSSSNSSGDVDGGGADNMVNQSTYPSNPRTQKTTMMMKSPAPTTTSAATAAFVPSSSSSTTTAAATTTKRPISAVVSAEKPPLLAAKQNNNNKKKKNKKNSTSATSTKLTNKKTKKTTTTSPELSTTTAAAAAATEPSTTTTTTPTQQPPVAMVAAPSPSTLLFKSIKKSLQKQTLNFKINTECTSMCVSPSGHFLWAGFSDGTLRVFDLTGSFGKKKDNNHNNKDKHHQQQQDSSHQPPKSNNKKGATSRKRKQKQDSKKESAGSDNSTHNQEMTLEFEAGTTSVAIDSSSTTTTNGGNGGGLVNSKVWQSYGAVACQIHARGVHTDLQTTIDISPDGRFVFCGVQRGAVELYAVDISALERTVIDAKRRWIDRKLRAIERGEDHTEVQMDDLGNILDYVQVYCHSDAKLKGFGACTAMKLSDDDESHENNDGSSPPKATQQPSYFLLTGKGIKNIHIWKFTPPLPGQNSSSASKTPVVDSNGEDDDDDDDTDNGLWEQLYDAPTNGNTISLLDFYRTSQGKLLAISKSDTQKLRLWDLSDEETRFTTTSSSRPKRPPYQDVANSQAALGIAGSLCVCGGESMYNQLSIVSLDQPKNAYNHTELALPTSTSSSNAADGGNALESNTYTSSRRFQRRGEMKSIVNVATLRTPDANHYALLELSDGSLLKYSADGGTSAGPQSNDSRLTMATPENTGIPALPAEFWSRSLCLANISGIVVAATSMYNANTSKGRIVIRALQGLNKKSGKKDVSPKKSPKASNKSKASKSMLPPKSPVAADSQALRNAVEAPPNSVPRRRLVSNSTAEVAKGSPDDRRIKTSSDTVHVSPEQQPNMTTPARPTVEPSSEAAPLISTAFQPKKIEPLNSKEGTELKTPSNSTTPLLTKVTDVKPPPSNLKRSRKESKSATPNITTSTPQVQQVDTAIVTGKQSKKAKRRSSTPKVLPTKESHSVTPVAATTSNDKPQGKTKPPVVATVPTATPREQKSKEDLDTAMLLTSLSNSTNASVTPLKPSPKSDRPISTTVSPKTSRPSAQQSRDDKILEQIRVHYKQVHSMLNGLSAQSSSLIQERISNGPLVPLFSGGKVATDGYSEHYSRLVRDHTASHLILQKRILRAAESTIRILLDGEAALEEARNEIQEIIKSHEEILCDTLQRQELERSTLAAQYPREASAAAVREAAVVRVEEYPCQLAFQKVQDICSTIKRPVGRPRSTMTTPILS